MLYGGHRDDVTDILRVLLVLEGHADDTTILIEGGASGVARVDGGIDLDGEQIGARVGIALDLDARDHAHRHAHALAALGIAHHRHFVLEARDGAELERRRPFPKALVFDGERGEVTLVRDLAPRGDILARVARLAHLHVRRVRHHVRVREDAHLALVID